ncbi:hypothetical protein ACFL60_07240 [Candidatus Omnitrophota bacterium]
MLDITSRALIGKTAEMDSNNPRASSRSRYAEVHRQMSPLLHEIQA